MVPLGALALQCFVKVNLPPSATILCLHLARELVQQLLVPLRIVVELLLQGLVFSLLTSNLLTGEWEFTCELLIVSCQLNFANIL